jgi:hypothetical protein
VNRRGGSRFAEGTRVDDLIRLANEVELTDEFVIAGVETVWHSGSAVSPAIAVPLESKANFECPSAHLELLKQLLPHVTTILIIGWRGADKSFVDQISDHLASLREIYVVAESQDAAETTIGNLTDVGFGTSDVAWHAQQSSGFERFVRQELPTFIDRL